MATEQVEDVYSLSPMQTGMLFQCLYAAEHSVYLDQQVYEVAGELDVSSFKRAWEHLIARHAVLRTSFHWEGLEEPLQIVHPSAELPITEVDWRDLSADEQRSEQTQLLNEERATGIDLAEPPLMRLTVIRTSPANFKFIWTTHHLLFDRWSGTQVFDEFKTVYDALRAGRSVELRPTRPYREYIRWLRAQNPESAEAYWRRQLSGFSTPTTLPIDRDPGGLSSKGNSLRKTVRLSEQTSSELIELARRNRLTLNTLIQGAWAVLLARYTGESDVLFGATVSGRPASLPGVESMVGIFINSLPVRVHTDESARVVDWLQRLQSDVVEMREYEYCSLVQIQGWSDIPRGTPMFESLVVVQNAQPAEARSGSNGTQASADGIQIRSAGGQSSVDFPLYITVVPEPEIRFILNYSPERFDGDSIARLLGHLRTLLESIVADPEQPVHNLALLTEVEQRQISEWSCQKASNPAAECLHELFESQAAKTPDAVALQYEDRRLTYDELNRWSNRIAHHLRERGVGPETLVGISADRSIEMVVGLLGILKAGGAYVPLDPSYPPERLAYMAADAGLRLVLARTGDEIDVPATDSILIDDQAAFSGYSDLNPEPVSVPDHLAYVIYTSGTTGRPKGVLSTHGNVVRLMSATQQWYGFNDKDVWTLFHSLAFDFSVWEIWGALLYGGRLIVIPFEVSRSPEEFHRLVHRERVTVLNQTPSAFRQFIQADLKVDGEALPNDLRYIIFGGEKLELPTLQPWFDKHGDDQPQLVNMYGITETTVHVTYRPIRQKDMSSGSLIGCAIPDLELRVLDPSLHPVPIGVPGELYVGGAGLARGYLNRPDLTAERFVPNPFVHGVNEETLSTLNSQLSTRLYRTGDLCRYLPNGDLEYLGRADDQVKIRGFRIELGEIESALSQHPAVKVAVVLAREDTREDKRLIAYVVGAGPEADSSSLRDHARQTLPEYMVPSAFVWLDSLPLSSNGKLDRRALPAPEMPQGEEDYAGPRTPIEEALAEIWCGVLGLERVGIHDSFFDLGGHSLLATQAISRIRATLQIDLPLRALFESPTIAALSTHITSARLGAGELDLAGRGSSFLTALRRLHSDSAPLSFAQQRLWFLDKLDPGSSVYNMPAALRLTGELNVAAFEQALGEIIRRHESLRTTFAELDGIACQIVHPQDAVNLSIVDLRSLPEEQRTKESQRLVIEEARRPFDLETGPLLRYSLLQLTDDEHILLLCLHHIVADGWSMGVLRRELATLYNAFAGSQSSPLPDLPIQYADFASWQRDWLKDEVLERQIDYWRKQLAGAPAVLELPTDRPRPPLQTYNGAVQRLELPDNLCRELIGMGQQEGVTLFMTLLAAFQTLLYRYSGQDQIVVGSPIANRTQSEIEGLIGFFANMLAFHGDLSGDPTFTELLIRVRETALGAYDHQDVPFEKLVDELAPERSLSHSPIFQVAFALQDLPGGAGAELTGLKVEPIRGDGATARFDLLLTAIRTGRGLRLVVEYNTDLFEADRMERLLGHYQTLLEAIVQDAALPVSRLPILTGPERRQLGEWNTRRSTYPAEPCLHELFEVQVARNPDAIALQYEGRKLTYDELNRWSNRIAHLLRERGIGPETLVGVCADRSLEMVASLLGILKAGGAYIPLDPSYPADRFAYMAQDAGIEILLTHGTSAIDLPHSLRINIDDEANLRTYSDQNPPATTVPDNVAYVIYTSGSTGRPKGVLNTHANVVRLMTATQDWYGFNEGDVWTLFHSLAFDFSVWEIWGALLYGGRLIVVPFEVSRSPADLHRLVRAEGVTVLNQTPSAFRQFIQADSSADLELPNDPTTRRPNDLRYVIFGGEKLDLPSLEPWFAKHGDERPQLVNMYGITETTVHVTYRPIRQADLPSGSLIGCAIPDLELHVLGPSMQRVPVGIPGELYVGGPGLARGYLNRSDLTAERFVPNPFITQRPNDPTNRLYKSGDLGRYLPNGDIEYLGRADDQVKIRGFRIELGEVTNVLTRHPAVNEAVVLTQEETPGAPRLVAYVIANNGAVGPSELRDHVLTELPDYMAPAAYVFLNSWPLTPNGKLDRKALPAPDTARPDVESGFASPRNPTEETLAAIWRQVLRIERVGIHDNFFELGGDSILSIQIIARANSAGIHLTARQVFQHQTIAGLASVAGTDEQSAAEQGVVAGDVSLTPIQRWFFEQHLADSHHHNQARLLQLDQQLEPDVAKRAITALIEHHDALRLRFTLQGTGWEQTNAAEELNDYFKVIDLSDSSDRRTAIVQECSRVQASLNLQKGPLLRAAYVNFGPDEPRRLLIAIHHLGVDAVSWRILLDDLHMALNQLQSGQEVKLPRKTTSYRQWSQRLEEYATSPEIAGEVGYWQSIGGTASLPTDHVEGDNTTASERALRVSLGEEQTRALLTEVPAVYHTQINDILLTALVQAFNDWTGSRSLLVNLEGHGRESLFPDIDLSRTVGWFTSLYPVRLEIPPDDDPGESIKELKETLRRIPKRGLGYGLLRYCSPDNNIRESLAAHTPPQVSFNYHGQVDAGNDENPIFRTAAESPGLSRSPNQRRSHLIDVIGMVRDGRLQLTWVYSESFHNRSTVEQLGAGFIDHLTAVIQHCRLSESGGYTPSDFLKSRLNWQSLDRLIAAVGRHERIEDIYPLSPLQSGMLFRTLFVTEHAVYLDQHLHALQGDLNIDAFKSAWQTMLDRHSILRTSFHWEGLDEPLQVVHAAAQLEIDFRDLSALPKDKQRSALDVLVIDDRARGVDLSRAPLMRLTLIKLDSADWRFIWTIHHLLLDRWSTAQVLDEMLTVYESLRQGNSIELPPLRPYGDFIGWLQDQEPGAAEMYWRRTLAGIENPTILPVDKAPGGGPGPDLPLLRHVRLSEQSSEALHSLARQNHLTFNTLIQGGWALLLSRYTGENDVLFGATVSGRPASLAGIESMVGMFINSLPIRVKVQNSMPLLDWLSQLQENMLELREYEYSSLAQIQASSDLPRGTPPFESLVIVQNTPGADLGRRENATTYENEGLKLRALGAQSSVDFPLYLTTSAGPRISLSLTYDTSRYDAADIDRMLGHLKTLLESMAEADTSVPIRSLSMLDENELQTLLIDRNSSARDYRDIPVHQLFEEQALRTPDAIALEFGGQTLTYSELNSRANHLANFLRERGAGPDVLVGLCVERSMELVIAVYGILKSGGAYVPLDPAYPPERLARMIADSQAPLLLTQDSLKESLPESSALVISLDGDWHQIEQSSDENLTVTIGRDNLVYVIYTSGSTGVPKGTAVCHGGFTNLVQWFIEEFGYAASDRSLLLTSISFDLTQKNLYAVLAVGGTLHLAASGIYDPDAVAGLIAGAGITHLNCTPSHFYPLTADPSGYSELASLRYVYLGGEPIELPKLTPWLQSEHCNAQLANTYGPTECSDVTTYYVMPAAQSSDQQITIPIGRPIPNVTHYVLDRNLHPVPDGLPGELCIGGSGVGRGYLGRSDMTAERFLPDQFLMESPNNPITQSPRLYRTGDLVRYDADGNLLYLGRLDHQVKVRGFRIELGEIEAILQQHPLVTEAVVLAREDSPGDKRLAAYIVSSNGAPNQGDLRTFLKAKLPDYMVPACFVSLESLPLSPNGKVDRKALPAPESNTQEDTFVAPRTPIQEGLAEIWTELLRAPQVGIRDSFFDLGGHSLLATQTISRIRAAFQIDLPLRALFESPTIEELAEVISLALRSGEGQRIPPLVSVPRDRPLPLSFAQERLWFINTLDPNSAVYNVLIPLRLQGTLDSQVLQRSLEEVVRRHEILRSNFMDSAGEVIQVISDDISIPFEVVNFTNNSDAEQAARLECDRQLALPFDLTADRLIRAALIELAIDDHILVITLHHIVADGWSNGVLVKDLSAFYHAYLAGAPSPLPDLPVQYGDYAAWQRGWLQGDELERQAIFWKGQLAGAPPVLNLPTDRPRDEAKGHVGDRFVLDLQPELSRQLRTIGREEHATQFMTLLAVFNVVLHAHTGQDDLVIGTDEAGRNHRALENLVGFFVNHLVLRTDVSGNPSFRELVGRVRDVCLGAYAHQDFPFDKLVEIVRPDRRGSHTPLFQVLFVMNIPAQGASFDSKLKVSGLKQGPGSSKYDIGLFLTDTPSGLMMSWIYRTELFDESTIRAMAEDFEAVARRVAESAGIRLSELKAMLLDQSIQRSEKQIQERRHASRPSLRSSPARRT